MAEFRRNLLTAKALKPVVAELQQRLVELVDLALQLKQAHWCVVGQNFRAVHLQLDEIIETVRSASDDVAERIATLGVAPDGRSQTVAENSKLEDISNKFEQAPASVTVVADRLKQAIDGLRASIETLDDLDPISQDLLISITRPMEKHLWMVQSQEI